MGCDIHHYLERKTDTGWKCLNQLDPDFDPKYREEYGEEPCLDKLPTRRNYPLFALLAEVRGDFKYSFKERGIPEDMSPEVAEEYESWSGDAHTPSWLLLSELQVKATELLIVQHEEGLSWAAQSLVELIQIIKDFPGAEGAQEDELRMVFWFDN